MHFDNNVQFSMICLKILFTIHSYRYLLLLKFYGISNSFNRFNDIQYKRKMNKNKNTLYKKSHCKV